MDVNSYDGLIVLYFGIIFGIFLRKQLRVLVKLNIYINIKSILIKYLGVYFCFLFLGKIFLG